MFRRRTVAVFAALTALSLPLLAGCSGGSDADAAGEGSDGAYKLGATMALTGDQASLGKDVTIFMEYATADANEAYAGDDIEIELLVEDTQATAELGVQALNKLATVEGAPMVTTAWSAVVNAMAPMAEELGVAVLNGGANSPELEGASPFLANFYTLASVEMKKFATWLHGEYDFNDAAVIYVTNPSGEGGADVFRDTWEEEGGDVVAFEGVAPSATDVSSTVTKVLEADPEVVHIHTTSTEGGNVIRTLRDQGFDGQITTFTGVAADAAARNVAGTAADGIIYSTVRVYDTEDPAFTEIVERFTADQGRDPIGLSYTISFYDSVFLYAELIKQLRTEDKEVTGENLIEAMAGGTFTVPFQGEVTFTDDLTLQGAIAVWQIDNAADAVSDDALLAVVE